MENQRFWTFFVKKGSTFVKEIFPGVCILIDMRDSEFSSFRVLGSEPDPGWISRHDPAFREGC